MTSESPVTDIFSSISQNGTIVVPWKVGMELGRGYDSIRNQIKGKTDPSADLITYSVTQSQDIATSVGRVENESSLREMIGNDTDTTIGYGPVSVSASSKFSKESTYNAYSLYFLVKSRVINSPILLKNEITIGAAAKVLNSSEFFNTFGNFFVNGVITGGEFYALLEIATTSKEDKEKLEVSVGTSVTSGEASFNLTNKFTREVSSLAKTRNVTYFTAYTGTFGASAPMDTVEDITTFAKGFPASVTPDKGETLYAIMTPYDNLSGFNQKLSVDMMAIEEIKKNLVNVFTRAKYINDSINFALTHVNEFSDTTSQLEKVQQQLTDVFTAVIAARRQIDIDPTQKITIPALPDLSKLPIHISSGQRAEFNPFIVDFISIGNALVVLQGKLKSVTNESAHFDFVNLLKKIQASYVENLRIAQSFLNDVTAYIPGIDAAKSIDDRVEVASLLQNTIQVALFKRQSVNTSIKNQYLVSAQSNSTTAATFITALSEFILKYYPELSNVGANSPNPDPQLGALYGGLGFWKNLESLVNNLKNGFRIWPVDQPVSKFLNYNKQLWGDFAQNIKDGKFNITKISII